MKLPPAVRQYHAQSLKMTFNLCEFSIKLRFLFVNSYCKPCWGASFQYCSAKVCYHYCMEVPESIVDFNAIVRKGERQSRSSDMCLRYQEINDWRKKKCILEVNRIMKKNLLFFSLCQTSSAYDYYKYIYPNYILFITWIKT